jgi:hypothetical protein
MADVRVVGITVVATVALFAVILTSAKITADERSRVVSFIPMFVASAVFWSLFQQQSTVVAVYADQRLDRTIFGWTMPPSFVQSINPVFIIIFAGVFAALWTRLGDRQPPTPVKFALGTLFMGVAFLLFLPFASGAPNSTPLLWLVLILFFFTLAELCLSPVGRSLSTNSRRPPHADDRAVLPLDRRRHGHGRDARGLLRPRARGLVLPDHRRRLRRRRRAAAPRPALDQRPDGRRALTPSGASKGCGRSRAWR